MEALPFVPSRRMAGVILVYQRIVFRGICTSGKGIGSWTMIPKNTIPSCGPFKRVTGDFHSQESLYVFSMSVTKWVHLNGGDDRLKTMFQKIFDALSESGILVLEPQPWSSYRKKALYMPPVRTA